MNSKLLPHTEATKLPKLYETEHLEDPIVLCKFFFPTGNWSWYAIEFDGNDIFYGYVVGFRAELGYFSLKELESVKGPFGLGIERDLYFNPQLLSEIKELYE